MAALGGTKCTGHKVTPPRSETSTGTFVGQAKCLVQPKTCESIAPRGIISHAGADSGKLQQIMIDPGCYAAAAVFYQQHGGAMQAAFLQYLMQLHRHRRSIAPVPTSPPKSPDGEVMAYTAQTTYTDAGAATVSNEQTQTTFQRRTSPPPPPVRPPSPPLGFGLRTRRLVSRVATRPLTAPRTTGDAKTSAVGKLRSMTAGKSMPCLRKNVLLRALLRENETDKEDCQLR